MSSLEPTCLTSDSVLLRVLEYVVGISCPSIRENKKFQFNLLSDSMFNFSTLSQKIQMFTVV